MHVDVTKGRAKGQRIVGYMYGPNKEAMGQTKPRPLHAQWLRVHMGAQSILGLSLSSPLTLTALNSHFNSQF